MSAPTNEPGWVAHYAVAWSDRFNGGPNNYDPPQGGGWYNTITGEFVPYPPRDTKS